MPKFFYTVFVVNLAMWAGLLFLGSEIAPASASNIVIFLIGLYVCFGLTLGLALFIYQNAKMSVLMDRRKVFKKSIRYGYFAGFVIIGTQALRVLHLMNFLNYLLFLVLCYMIYKQLRNLKA